MVRVGARQAILAECERWSSAIHRTGYIPHDMLEPCRPALVFVQNARQGSPHVVISNFVTAVQEFVTGQGHTRELAKT